MGLHIRKLPSSFCHLQSIISSCLAGGPRPLQPQPMFLLSRAINQWDFALNGETADNGHPVDYSPTNHNHISQTRSSTFSYQALFSQNSVVATAHADPSAWSSRVLSQHPLFRSLFSSGTPYWNQVNWPWEFCKCLSCPMECHFTDASSVPSSHPKSKSSLPGSPL